MIQKQNFLTNKFKEIALQNIKESNSIEVNFNYKDLGIYLDLNESKEIEYIEIFKKETKLNFDYKQIKTYLNQ